MKFPKIYFLTLLVPVFVMVSSCSSNTSKADEPEVTKMDSISAELEKTNKELDEKTKSLEASIEEAEKLENKN